MPNGHREHAETLYYHIAGDALKHAQKGVQKGNDELRLAQYVCASMVFSALTLEAYINQEYKSHLQTENLDLQDREVRSKWRKLPVLLGGRGTKTFKKGGPPFRTFNELIVLRNNVLVHFKGGRVGQTLDKRGKTLSSVVKDVERAESYFNCIAAMIKKLNELTSSQTSVPDFLNGDRYLASFAVTSP